MPGGAVEKNIVSMNRPSQVDSFHLEEQKFNCSCVRPILPLASLFPSLPSIAIGSILGSNRFARLCLWCRVRSSMSIASRSLMFGCRFAEQYELSGVCVSAVGRDKTRQGCTPCSEARRRGISPIQQFSSSATISHSCPIRFRSDSRFSR